MADSSPPTPTPILSPEEFDRCLNAPVPMFSELWAHDAALRDAVAVLTEERDAARQTAESWEKQASVWEAEALKYKIGWERQLTEARARVAVLEAGLRDLCKLWSACDGDELLAAMDIAFVRVRALLEPEIAEVGASALGGDNSRQEHNTNLASASADPVEETK